MLGRCSVNDFLSELVYLKSSLTFLERLLSISNGILDGKWFFVVVKARKLLH